MSSENSKSQFFGNNDVPYQLKAGLVAVLAHTPVLYQKNSLNQDMFMSMILDKDIGKDGSAGRVNKGAISFTFGVPSSMAEDNYLASMKAFAELYPSMGGVVEQVLDGSLTLTDEEVCKKILDASAKRFNHSPEGTSKNWDLYVMKNLETFSKKALEHYPGIVTPGMFDNIRRSCSDYCKTNSARTQMV